jgi:hypothetical protein
MTDFLARMAHEGAVLEIPARIDRGGGELLIRGHRYGQPGVVHVLAGGVRLETLVYRKDSYPWDVERIPVPEALTGRPLASTFSERRRKRTSTFRREGFSGSTGSR